MPLNMAEAAGKTTADDSSRFLVMARGSAMECAAVLDVCRVLKICSANPVREGKDLWTRIVSMLTRMIRF